MKTRFACLILLFTMNSFAQQKGRILVTDLYQVKTGGNIKFSHLQRADQMLRTMEFFEQYRK